MPLCRQHGGERREGAAERQVGGLRRGARTRDDEVDNLVAFANARAVNSVEKLHGRSVAEKLFAKLVPTPLVSSFLVPPEWLTHRGGEASHELNSTDLELRTLLHDSKKVPLASVLQRILLTRVWFNGEGLLEKALATYEERSGQAFGEGRCFDESAFTSVVNNTTIKQAYAGYQRTLWNAEHARQAGQRGAHKQKQVMAKYIAELVRKSRFTTAARQLEKGQPLGDVLEKTLLVHTEWHRMLMSRDLAVVRPKAANGFTLAENDFVGEGAEAVLRRCTAHDPDDSKRLRALLPLVKPRLVDPSLWVGDFTISHLEDLCCELRRWENRADKEKGRLRTTGDRAVRAQLRRRDRLLSLPNGHLGLRLRPKPPDAFQAVGVVLAHQQAT